MIIASKYCKLRGVENIILSIVYIMKFENIIFGKKTSINFSSKNTILTLSLTEYKPQTSTIKLFHRYFDPGSSKLERLDFYFRVELRAYLLIQTLAGTTLSGLVPTTNVRLGRKCLFRTNGLAYYLTVNITPVKRFMLKAPDIG